MAELRYKPWGEERFTDGTTPTDYTYTGQYSNMSDIKLMFYNARWYDPALGRFAQADTVVPDGVQGYDRYAYVNNNPIGYNDPTGHSVDCGLGDPDCSAGQFTGPSESGDGGNNGSAGQTAALGAFQLLPASSSYMTYSQIVQEGYSGWWLSGAPAYGDRLLPGMPVNSNQVGVGAAAVAPAVIDDWALMLAPYAQRAIAPYDQSVSLDYTIQYNNGPRNDAYMVVTVKDVLITNSSDQLVYYSVLMRSPSYPGAVASGLLSAAPNETLRAAMPTNFSFIGALDVNVRAFTSCVGVCISSNPPPQALVGYGNFGFSP